MKIYYDNIIYNLQNSGGGSVYWYELSKRLIRDNYDIIFIDNGMNDKNIFRNNILIENRLIKKEIQFPIKILRYFPVMTKLLKYSIFHSSYYRIACQKNIYNITTVYDFIYERHAKCLSRTVHSLQKANAIKKANGIICISENTKRDMIEFYPEVTNKNIKVIYIGVSDEYYQIEIDTSNKYYKYIKDRYIVFIGSRLYYKNFDLAVKAVSQINQARLFIIGGGPLNNDEKKILKKYLNNNYMHFIGLSNADINILYNYAYCLIYPSSYEGFGIPVIEAMKAGCPVVALNNSSIPEVSGNSAVLVSKLDVDVFSEAMLNFEDERFRNEIKTRGLVRARKFSWEKTYFETMTFYKQIIENQ